MKFEIEGPSLGKSAVCEPILRDLPEWFGIEAAIVHYVAEIDILPTFLALHDGGALGFLSVKQHMHASAELYVMAVCPDVHHQGVGRALVIAAQEWLKDRNVQYLQVKTLGPSHPDEGYAKTRLFYEAVGFVPLEEFTQLWDERNPCLILVKKI